MNRAAAGSGLVDHRAASEDHTFSCALPVRGGVCNCQTGHNPSTNP